MSEKKKRSEKQEPQSGSYIQFRAPLLNEEAGNQYPWAPFNARAVTRLAEREPLSAARARDLHGATRTRVPLICAPLQYTHSHTCTPRVSDQGISPVQRDFKALAFTQVDSFDKSRIQSRRCNPRVRACRLRPPGVLFKQI